MMKRIIAAIFILVGFLCIILIVNSRSSTKQFIPPEIEYAPSLGLLQAVQIAQSHLQEQMVDTSSYYLDNVRFQLSSPWMEGKHWIVTWTHRQVADDGQISVYVDMNKNVHVRNDPTENQLITQKIGNAPSLDIVEAVQIAQSRAKTNGRYLDNVRLLQSSSFMEGEKSWIVTWKRGFARPVMGGQCFVYVGMDKTVHIHGGL